MAKINLDLKNPANERDRLFLTIDEIDLIKRRELANQAIVLLAETSRSVPEIAEELGLDPVILMRFATSEEFPEYADIYSTKLAMMFLDLDRRYTRDDIAREMGMTEKQLRLFVGKDVFKKAYNELFHRLTDDPGPRAVQLRILENLLPEAYHALTRELSEDAPWTIRQKARQDVFRLAGITELEGARRSDREEAIQFLKESGINTLNVSLTKNEINVPPEYIDAFQETVPIVVDAVETTVIEEE